MDEDRTTANVFVRSDGAIHAVPIAGADKPEVPAIISQKWQHALNLVVMLVPASVSMVTQIDSDCLSVFLTSTNPENPFNAGECYTLGTGVYCENVLGTDTVHAVVDAGNDARWRDNPDMEQGMANYYGIPLHWNDGSFCGTLCVLDRSRAVTEQADRDLLNSVAQGMENDLKMLCLVKKQREQLETYSKTMGAMLQHAPGGIFSYSAAADEQFTFISDNMLAFLGYTREEFRAKTQNRFSLMIYPPDRQRALDAIDEQIAQSDFDNCDYRIARKDGSLVWVHDEGHIVTDDEGKRWFYVVIVDITERVLAQQEEQRAYQRSLNELLKANPHALMTFELNLSQNICVSGQGVSPADVDAVHSGTVDELFSKALALTLGPEDRRNAAQMLDRSALLAAFDAGQTDFTAEYRRLTAQGKAVWIRASVNLLKNPETGDVEGVTYSQDITRAKQQEEVFRVITDREFDLVALVHLRENTIEFLNLSSNLLPRYHEKLGGFGKRFDYDATRRFAAAAWVADEDRERYLNGTPAAIIKRELNRADHYELIIRGHYTGHPDQYMCRKIQHYYLNDDSDTVLVVQADVTETYQLQQKEMLHAKAEAERITDIMDSITTGICELHMPDPDHLQLVYVNDAMYRLLGYEPLHNDITQVDEETNELVASYAQDAFAGVHPDDVDRLRKAFHDHYTSDFFVVDDYRTMGSDGDYFWIKEEVKLREVRPDCRVFYATYHDVSEEVRLRTERERQLETEQELRKQAMAANAAKSEFISRISHDIRTPINAITGMTAFAKQDIDDRPRALADLDKIEGATEHLMYLINDVLDISRAESGKVELHPEPYAFEEFAKGLREMFQSTCVQRGLVFRIDGGERTFDVMVDRVRYDQIAMNLVSNAVKYTPRGGTISLIGDAHRLPDGRIDCGYTVEDTGIGMSEAFQRKMFEPFVQETDNPTRSTITAGTGLGLSIVKRLVDLMGGTINVESALGVGTRISVHLTLPEVSPDQAAQMRERRRMRVDDARHSLSGRVLLAEDNALNAEISVRLLEGFGLQVTTAVDGREALDMFTASEAGYFRMILMDIQMPIMDGYQATRAIRALDRADARTVPIFAMTADAFSDAVRKSMEAGMDGHISKPIDPDMLFTTLRAHLDSSSA